MSIFGPKHGEMEFETKRESQYIEQQVREAAKMRDSYKSQAKEALKAGNTKGAEHYAANIANLERDIQKLNNEKEAYEGIGLHAGMEGRKQNGRKSGLLGKALKYANGEAKRANKEDALESRALDDSIVKLQKAKEANYNAAGQMAGSQYVPQNAQKILDELKAEIATEKTYTAQVAQQVAQAQPQST